MLVLYLQIPEAMTLQKNLIIGKVHPTHEVSKPVRTAFGGVLKLPSPQNFQKSVKTNDAEDAVFMFPRLFVPS